MLLSITYSECQAGGLFSRIDHQTSEVLEFICSYSSCSDPYSKEI